MKDKILEADFIQDMIDTTTNLYRLGWDERNGGNISFKLNQEELIPYLDTNQSIRTLPLNFDASDLIGHFFLVTGSGKYFKNVEKTPKNSLGIIKISENGDHIDLLWGFEDGTLPTSELPAHLMSHIARLKVDTEHRVIMHNHATHLLAMTFTHKLTEKDFTKTLWKMCTECLVVFPEGISILPWLVPGTKKIGLETAKKMRETRLVIWPFHGIYGAGRTIDEVFGLIETAEKAAEIYTHVMATGGIKQAITDEQLKELAEQFKVNPHKNYL